MLLSVLIPSIPRRFDKVRGLVDALEAQADPEMEVLVLMDNCRRPVGHKRNALQEMARGRFVCHIDDDEMVALQFVPTVLAAIREADDEVDVIAYDAMITIDNSVPFRARTGMGFPVGQVQARPNGGYFDIQRPPWHWCAWRRDLAVQGVWPDFYWGDDWHWLTQLYPKVRRSAKIDEMLFHHRFSSTDSAGSNEHKT